LQYWADGYEEALERAQASNRGSIDVHNKNTARKVLEKEARNFVQGFLARNPYVRGITKITPLISLFAVIKRNEFYSPVYI
jgi:hypothetical protein